MVRDRIRARLEKNDPIWLREFLYPLAQGYDAVNLKADVQMGATEQIFNLMAGRKLQEFYGQKPLIALTFPVLVGTDGTNRMSKSRGNYIGIAEAPETIYGKTMSIPDNVMYQYFELVTDISLEELVEIKKEYETGNNPMALKKRLARTLVTQFYSAKDAAEAESHFERTVQNKEVPDEINVVIEVPTLHLNIKTFAPTIVLAGLAKSNSDANRLINQGAVSIDGEKINGDSVDLKEGSIVKVGKRSFGKISLKKR
jgi:tyrosyl-tRNA synthetase